MVNTLHLKAPGNWMNDPNGFIYYKGKYHLFYQYFPCAPIWGTMHWGHAVSEDLIHWTHLGVALYPTKAYDRNGVFSGSAIEIEGKMCLYYTAVRYVQEEEENIHAAVDGLSVQSQVMIVSEDGMKFDNREGKCLIIPPIACEEIGDSHDCRDPKVWREKGKYYMCLGSTWQKKEGVLLLFSSEDGVNWSYLNRLQDGRLGKILECPDLFAVDNQYVLISSPMKILEGTKYPENQTIVRLTEFDAERGKVTLGEAWQYFDYGMDLYAPQSNVDEQGQRVVIAWVRMPEAVSAEYNTAAGQKCWNGMMALPRVVSVKEGHIYTSVHPNVRAYFADSSEAFGTAQYTGKKKDGNYQIFAHLREGECIEIAGFKITLRDGCVQTDRSGAIPQEMKLHCVCKTPFVGTECELEIYREPNLIEVFVNDGQYVISNVLYPD